MSLIWKKKSNYKKALEVLEEAISIDPKMVGAFSNKAVILYEQEKYEESAMAGLQALNIDPRDDLTLCNLGLALTKVQYTYYAKIAFEESLSINPGNKACLINYLLFLLETKQRDKFPTVLKNGQKSGVLENSDYKVL